MMTYKKPIITGQQRILLNKYKNGKIKETDLYRLLASRVNEIPRRLVSKASDKECINWISRYSITNTNVHETINFWARYKENYGKSRFQNFVYKK